MVGCPFRKEIILTNCELQPGEQTAVKFESKYSYFHQECALKNAAYGMRWHLCYRFNVFK